MAARNLSKVRLNALLRDVSRSFYLSLRWLPGTMRAPCALGYLLARLSDTVADTAQVPIAQRQILLIRLRDAYLSQSSEPLDELTRDLRASFGNCQIEPGERRLLERSGRCLGLLRELERDKPEAAANLHEVLACITAGQMADLTRFGRPGALNCLGDADELWTYCDQVAGSVGRFWTRLARLDDPDFAREDSGRMTDWATRYGCGLQLVNIIRDLHEDLPQGRCYLPAEDLTDAGWDGRGMQFAVFETVARNWLVRAEQDLRAGVRYAENLRGARLRWATVLPAAIGAASIHALRRRNPIREQVKIPRSSVRRILFEAAKRVATRRRLTPWFERLLDSE